MESVQTDRRLFERFPARFPIKFEHERGDYGANLFLRDASASGVRVTTKKQLFLQDCVALEVKLPDAAYPLKLNGRVAWAKISGPDLWDAGIELHQVELMRMQRMYKFFSPD